MPESFIPEKSVLADGGQFYPPAPYSALWLYLGLAAIAVIILGYAVILFVLRKRRQRTALKAPAESLEQIRGRYLHSIDSVARAHERGVLGERAAHLELSRLVRRYTKDATGIPAEAMTLSDLKALGIPQVPDAVELYYPAEFGAPASSSIPVPHSVDVARAVVRG